MKTTFHTASALLCVLVSVFMAGMLASCSDDSTLAENDGVLVPIETIPALYTLDCADVVDLLSVTTHGEFKVNTFVRKRGSSSAFEYHAATTRFDEGSNHLRILGDKPLYVPSSDYEYIVTAVYPSTGMVSVDSEGELQYDGCVIAGETLWLHATHRSAPFLDIRPVNK